MRITFILLSDILEFTVFICIACDYDHSYVESQHKQQRRMIPLEYYWNVPLAYIRGIYLYHSLKKLIHLELKHSHLKQQLDFPSK